MADYKPMGPTLFVGVVTHERSRFRLDGSLDGLLDALAGSARAAGCQVRAVISARDDYDPRRFPLTRGLVVRSAIAQARLEYRWRRYPAAGPCATAGLERIKSRLVTSLIC